MEPGERDPRTTDAAVAFDLNLALASLRERLGDEGLASAELDELEDHLRTQWTELVAQGLRADEAWIIAERRLGTPKALGREFGTLESRLPAPLIWMVIGYLALSVGDSSVVLTGMVVQNLTKSGTAGFTACVLLLVAYVFSLARSGRLLLERPMRTLAALLVAKLGTVCWYYIAFLMVATSGFEWTDMLVAGSSSLALWLLAIPGAFVLLLINRRRHRRPRTT